MTPLDKIRKAATGEGNALAELKKKMTYAKAMQARFLSTWELNRAFFAGNQWVYRPIGTKVPLG